MLIKIFMTINYYIIVNEIFLIKITRMKKS